MLWETPLRWTNSCPLPKQKKTNISQGGKKGHILYLELKEEKADSTLCEQQGSKQMNYHHYRYSTFTVYSSIYTFSACRQRENRGANFQNGMNVERCQHFSAIEDCFYL